MGTIIGKIGKYGKICGHFGKDWKNIGKYRKRSETISDNIGKDWKTWEKQGTKYG